jgi:tetratricopeptide (TPR) repeat protein
MRLLCALLTALVSIGCAESSRESLEGARKALAESRYADAIQAADAGLAGSADERTRWGLELVKLEALAREGQGDAAVAQLEKLGGSQPDRVKAAQYATTAGQLKSAGQGGAAIQALDLGLKRFPDDGTLTDLIEQARAAPQEGSDELEMLRSLGYVE